jgi:hypothetical protein
MPPKRKRSQKVPETAEPVDICFWCDKPVPLFLFTNTSSSILGGFSSCFRSPLCGYASATLTRFWGDCRNWWELGLITAPTRLPQQCPYSLLIMTTKVSTASGTQLAETTAPKSLAMWWCATLQYTTPRKTAQQSITHYTKLANQGSRAGHQTTLHTCTTGNSTTIKYAYYVHYTTANCTTVIYSDLHCTTYSKLHNTTVNYTKLH